METFLILKEAVKKVPFLKYALGLVGIAAGIAIIKSFGIENFKIPITSIWVFLVLMLLLFIFSKIASSKDKASKYAGYILIYLTVTIICVVAILFTTSVFFDYPKSIDDYYFLKQENLAEKKVDSNIKQREVDSSKKLETKPPNLHQATRSKEVKPTFDQFEISIQLASSSGGYNLIKLNGNLAKVLASSTPFNPRIFVESKANVIQLVEVITTKGDTCILNQIFDEAEKKNFPIRFVPFCKSHL